MLVMQTLQYHIVPPLFLLFFTPVVQALIHLAHPQPLGWHNLLGNTFSWSFVTLSLTWSYSFLRIPGPIHYGPATSFGQVPSYKANGLIYYFSTIALYLTVENWLLPRVSVTIYYNMASILASLNCVALALCVYLLVRGKLSPQTAELIPSAPLAHEFYRGMELHPRLLEVDVKQLTNCRMGMMLWQLLLLAFLSAGSSLHGFSAGHLVSVGLQSVYIFKFFSWECGYFSTLDITLDRAGYYLCWGCLVWVPCFYTLTGFCLVGWRSRLDGVPAVGVALLGLLAILINYRVDYEKQLFRSGRPLRLWGRPATSIPASYRSADGRTRHTRLLTAGCWGLARHLNYTFELAAALCWCAPGWGHGVWPFLYLMFLSVLLVHRVYRDETKCRDKYGTAWHQYCQRVPYRLLPGIY